MIVLCRLFFKLKVFLKNGMNVIFGFSDDELRTLTALTTFLMEDRGSAYVPVDLESENSGASDSEWEYSEDDLGSYISGDPEWYHSEDELGSDTSETDYQDYLGIYLIIKSRMMIMV